MNKTLLIMCLMLSVTMATINLESPSVYEESLGRLAPGQSVELTFSRTYGEQVFPWDAATMNLPEGWTYKTQLEANKVKVAVNVPNSAIPGEYDLGGKLSTTLGTRMPEDFSYKLTVTERAYYFTLSSEIDVKAGQTANIPLKVKSYSIADDELTFKKITGLPSKWTTTSILPLEKGTEQEIYFEIMPEQEGVYEVEFTFTTKSGAEYKRQGLLKVKPTLQSKFKAYNQGVALIPNILQPFYSILGLITSIIY